MLARTLTPSCRSESRRNQLGTARILIVEDDPGVVRLLEIALQRAGFPNVTSTGDPLEVELLRELVQPDLVVLDLHLPRRDGFQILEDLRASGGQDCIPVLVLSGDFTPEAKQRALSSGAKDFLAKPFDHVEVVLRIENLLETRFLHQELRGRNESLARTVETRTRELLTTQSEIVERLAQAVELHDDATGQHTRRVGETAARLAGALGLPLDEVELIRRAAPLHDVGKIGVPDGLLLKPGPLTIDEFEIVKTHTVIGGRILSAGQSELIHLAEEIALYHHEKWDGTGYPRGLTREEIPFAARIVGLADFCDALGHDRPYRRAWEENRIHAEVAAQAGRHFDPAIVKVYLGMASN